eukprot:5904290-Amphidinium_carterae.1
METHQPIAALEYPELTVLQMRTLHGSIKITCVPILGPSICRACPEAQWHPESHSCRDRRS